MSVLEVKDKHEWAPIPTEIYRLQAVFLEEPGNWENEVELEKNVRAHPNADWLQVELVEEAENQEKKEYFFSSFPSLGGSAGSVQFNFGLPQVPKKSSH